MTDARLNEIETKLAFAEDLLETLEQTVIRQQAQIDALQEQLRLLNRRVQDATAASARSTSPDDEIPPHY